MQSTIQDLAAGLYNFAVDFTQRMADRELSDGFPYSGVDRQHFIREWLMAIFWAMHRVPSKCDKEKLIGAIFKNWFEARGLNKVAAFAEQKLIISRLEEYDNAFVPSAGAQQFVLGGTIAKNLLQQKNFVLDAVVSANAAMAILLVIEEVRKTYEKYPVVG